MIRTKQEISHRARLTNFSNPLKPLTFFLVALLGGRGGGMSGEVLDPIDATQSRRDFLVVFSLSLLYGYNTHGVSVDVSVLVSVLTSSAAASSFVMVTG